MVKPTALSVYVVSLLSMQTVLISLCLTAVLLHLSACVSPTHKNVVCLTLKYKLQPTWDWKQNKPPFHSHYQIFTFAAAALCSSPVPISLPIPLLCPSIPDSSLLSCSLEGVWSKGETKKAAVAQPSIACSLLESSAALDFCDRDSKVWHGCRMLFALCSDS